jgi:hypothetical protein
MFHVGQLVYRYHENFIQEGRVVMAKRVYLDAQGTVRYLKNESTPVPKYYDDGRSRLTGHSVYVAEFFGERVEFSTYGKTRQPWHATISRAMQAQARDYERQIALARNKIDRMQKQMWKAREGSLRIRKDWSLHKAAKAPENDV